MGMSRDQRIENAKLRKERVRKLITQPNPLPLSHIMAMEGMTERPLRQLIKEIEREEGIEYIGTPACKGEGSPPPGLTEATSRLRSNLANELYRITNPHNAFGIIGREDAAPLVGLNPRQQIRAENKPFTHDWTLSQIERLARTLGEDPWEFLLKCLST